jgi:hypothetical protein
MVLWTGVDMTRPVTWLRFTVRCRSNDRASSLLRGISGEGGSLMGVSYDITDTQPG